MISSAIAGALAYVPYKMLDPEGSRQLETMRDELMRAHVEMTSLREQNAGLGSEIRALKEDPYAIEDIARHELGMVYPGELVIRVESR